ncbi:hypothetical protein PPL_10408 [Heterostelium album PN500]|uniref:Ankyrin repeat protein n=1 Tax=Heterostelium pallidum (strain ATCC 26659 / Pp 5 / PN500) TaxID=670386 RepID=D3BR05_HETP5|nr:hypothetical protein PPL_10408 [Heterostelium album PN500]EFA76191.1 hypothetical protein PPL_10408 [Heterostelium album PN500]|eukprot:XP_020428324.1 hypothetical protein PPL_10408 [Heterostelium album PN500]
MNKSLFICIFNNRVLNRLIFDQVRNHRCLLDRREIYKWRSVTRQPKVMAGNGYLEMLKVWFKSNNIVLMLWYDIYQILVNAIKTSHPNSLDIVKYLVEERKIADHLINDYSKGMSLYYKLYFTRSPLSNDIDMMIYLSGKEISGSRSYLENICKVFDSAARVGRVDMIEWLAEHIPQYRKGNNMYYHAVFGNHIHVLEYLKRRNNDLPQEGPYSKKLIDVAAERGNLQVLKWLDENKIGRASHDAIDNACAKGYLNIVEWLFENRTEGYTKRSMIDASTNGHLQIVKWIHFNGGNGYELSATIKAIDNAAKNDHLEMLKFLVDENIIRYSTTTYLLNMAVARGHVEVVEWLSRRLAQRGSVSTFEIAIDNCDLPMVKWLHQNQTVWLAENEYYDFSCPIVWAREYGHKDIERYLIEQHPLISFYYIILIILISYWSSVYLSVYLCFIIKVFVAKRCYMIEWLAKHKSQYRKGNSMYYQAVFGNHVHVLEYLKRENNDLDLTDDNDNARLIDVAVERGNLTIIKWLDENKISESTNQAMEIACSNSLIFKYRWCCWKWSSGNIKILSPQWIGTYFNGKSN